MADTDNIDIVELGTGDALAGLVLSTEAGWNQNEADWRFFLSEGVVFGMREGARLAATAALLPYSAGNAWISMVLVTADFRRRGIATRRPRRSMLAATKSWRCAISPRNSASASAALPSSPARNNAATC